MEITRIWYLIIYSLSRTLHVLYRLLPNTLLTHIQKLFRILNIKDIWWRSFPSRYKQSDFFFSMTFWFRRSVLLSAAIIYAPIRRFALWLVIKLSLKHTEQTLLFYHTGLEAGLCISYTPMFLIIYCRSFLG